jgi:hypothetical protein
MERFQALIGNVDGLAIDAGCDFLIAFRFQEFNEFSERF